MEDKNEVVAVVEAPGFLIDGIKTDEVKEESGVWHSPWTGMRILIASISNKNYKNYCVKCVKAHAIATGDIDVPADKMLEMSWRACSKYVILDWEGMKEIKGKGKNAKIVDVPYSEDKAYDYLLNVAEFRDKIIKISNDRENYRIDLLNTALKN